jgi:hypothetical protein
MHSFLTGFLGRDNSTLDSNDSSLDSTDGVQDSSFDCLEINQSINIENKRITDLFIRKH